MSPRNRLRYLTAGILGIASCSQHLNRTVQNSGAYETKIQVNDETERELSINLELFEDDVRTYNSLGIINYRQREDYLKFAENVREDNIPVENKKLLLLRLRLWLIDGKRAYENGRIEELERSVRKLEKEQRMCLPRSLN